MAAGKAGGVAEVAGEHVGVADGSGIGGEGLGDGFFDQAFLESDAEVAGEELDERLALGGVQGAQALGEEVDAGERSGRGGELLEKRREAGEVERFGFEREFLQQQAGGAGGVVLGLGNLAVAFLADAGEFQQGAAQRGGAGLGRAAIGCAGQGAAGQPVGSEREVIVARQAAEVDGEVADFFQAAAGFTGETAEAGEVGERADRPDVAGAGAGLGAAAGQGIAGGGRRELEVELVVAHRGPGIVAALAEFRGELAGGAVDGEDPLWPDPLDALEQAGVVGMVGQRDGFIDPVAVARSRGQGPAAEHGDAAVRDGAEELGADGVRRGDDGVAGWDRAIEHERLRQTADTGFAAGAGHFGDAGVEQGRDAVFVEQGERFLGLAERVAEEHGNLAIGQGVVDEAEDGAFHLQRRWKGVVGQAEGGFEDEEIGLLEDDGLGGSAFADLEVAGVEQGGPVGNACHVKHRGAGDVAGGQQAEAVAVALDGGAEGDGVEAGFGEVVARADQRGGDGGAERAFVAGEVVGVGVGDECPRFRVPGIEPEVEFREMEAALVTDFDHAGPRSSGMRGGSSIAKRLDFEVAEDRVDGRFGSATSSTALADWPLFPCPRFHQPDRPNAIPSRERRSSGWR